MVLENRVLRRIFGLTRVEVIGGWRGFHNFITFYPRQGCNPTFSVTHFPVVDINTRWAHPLPL
jgi:hypothetical protein